MQRGFAHFLLILLLLVLLVGGFFGFEYWKQFTGPKVKPLQVNLASPSPSLGNYKSPLGFEFSYPNNLKVQEDTEVKFNKRAGGDFRKNFTEYISYEPGKLLQAVSLLDSSNSFDKAPLTLWIFDNPGNSTIDEWYKNYWYYPFVWGDYSESKSKIAPRDDATIAGQLAQSATISYQPGSPRFIYLSKGGKMFLFRVLDQKIGEQILTSFKLL